MRTQIGEDAGIIKGPLPETESRDLEFTVCTPLHQSGDHLASLNDMCGLEKEGTRAIRCFCPWSPALGSCGTQWEEAESLWGSGTQQPDTWWECNSRRWTWDWKRKASGSTVCWCAPSPVRGKRCASAEHECLLSLDRDSPLPTHLCNTPPCPYCKYVRS